MTELVDNMTVRTTIEVAVSPARAFELFTAEMGSWWDADKHILQARLAEMIFEPFVGGHIIDRGTDGSECRWGRVLAYEPPHRVSFSWDIDLRWQTEADPDRCSEVEITFTPAADARTRVVLTHRHLDRHGPGWESMRDAVAGGWSLDGYAAYTRSDRDERAPVDPEGFRLQEDLGAAPETVFAAVASVDGLRGWWTTDVRGESEVGGQLTFTFSSGNWTTMRVDALQEPRAVEWTCVAQSIGNFNPPDEWVGTRVIFEISPRGAGSRLTLTHEGLSGLGCRDLCEAGWEHYMGTSLPQLLDTGHGGPRDPSMPRAPR